MRLYDYWSSSSAYRVRLALNLKGLAYDRVVVSHLDGEPDPAYATLNPQGFVPTLEVDGLRLFQSQAILEYLEERWPEPALLPADAPGRARVRAIAGMIACDIQPLNNQRVQDALLDEFGMESVALLRWYAKWIAQGFEALERLLANSDLTGRHCHGDAPTLADVFLIPQMFNARRWACDLTPYPTLARIEATCQGLAAFESARPERQPDAPRDLRHPLVSRVV